LIRFGDLEMRNLIGLLLLGLFLSGCYTNSLVYVAPVTSVVQGRTAETLISTSINYTVKKQTGKSPIEHVLTRQQIETYESKKKKLNPCEKNVEFCSSIKSRVEQMHQKFLSSNFQARIDKARARILKLNP
jgi:PBP1b-binding outer membrane lipoprotein LpoB